MSKQTKPQAPHNRVIAFIREKKYLRIIELSEMNWQAIFNGEGIGSGRQKKDVELAFYLNAKDEVIMRWDKPPIAEERFHRETNKGYVYAKKLLDATLPPNAKVEFSVTKPQEALLSLDEMDIFPVDFED